MIDFVWWYLCGSCLMHICIGIYAIKIGATPKDIGLIRLTPTQAACFTSLILTFFWPAILFLSFERE